MGGIDSSNVERVVLAGADRVAVVSAVVGAEDVAAAARDLVRRIEEAKTRRGRAAGEEENSDAVVS
jgi:thiamine-phosphate pyrophosphorylase